MQNKKPGILGLPQYHMETGELIDHGSVFDPFLNPIPNLDKNRTQVGIKFQLPFYNGSAMALRPSAI